MVFTDEGEGKFVPHEVHLGVETPNYYEILSGVTPGEDVVTSAEFLLDSEAQLQEAIQRRLDQKAAAKTASGSGAMSGMKAMSAEKK